MKMASQILKCTALRNGQISVLKLHPVYVCRSVYELITDLLYYVCV